MKELDCIIQAANITAIVATISSVSPSVAIALAAVIIYYLFKNDD